MNVTIEDKSNTEATLRVTVDSSELQSHFSHVAEHLGKNLKVAGFRPGKAPVALVRKQVGEQLFASELLEHVLPRTYYDAVVQENLTPVASPKVEVQEFNPDKELIYEAKVALLPEITLTDPAKIKVKAEKAELSDEEVEQALTDLRRMRASEAAVDRGSKKGDRMEVDFEGFKDGAPVQNTKSQNHPVVLGSNTLIPGFETELEGLKQGEEKRFDVVFPKDYHAQSLAGQKLTFFVKVHNVFEVTLPELSDEFAKGVGAFDSAEQLKEALRDNLLTEKQAKAKDNLRAEALTKFVEGSKVEVSPILVDQEVDQLVHDLSHRLSHDGATLEQYLQSINKSEADFRTDLREEAERRVKGGLVLAQYAKDQALDVSEQQIDIELSGQAASAGMKPDELQDQLKNAELRSRIRSQLITRAALDLLEEAVITS